MSFASPMSVDIERVRHYLQQLQDQITITLAAEENGENFLEDIWQHESGGGGRSRVLSGGEVFERAGVNFSEVLGQNLPTSTLKNFPQLIKSNAQTKFRAMGVSLVIHPHNPHVPTSHMNVRLIEILEGTSQQWWFGGGFDLTPYYGIDEDVVFWHQTAKAACDPFGANVYSEFKKNCDDYFFLPHRNEARGVGGIFFDHLGPEHSLGGDFERCFAIMRSVGDHYLKAYLPIVQRRKNSAFTQQEREFQLWRRGRYVEFNLVYDRGTLFGLQTKGRIESILMSLPPLVSWRYNYVPSPGSPEARLQEHFLKAKNWLASSI